MREWKYWIGFGHGVVVGLAISLAITMFGCTSGGEETNTNTHVVSDSGSDSPRTPPDTIFIAPDKDGPLLAIILADSTVQYVGRKNKP